MTTPRRALFLDRDGTVIEDENYLRDPAVIRFLPGAVEALRALSQAGYALVVVSNQSGIARGLISQDEFTRVHERFVELLRAAGVSLDGAYYCQHGPDDGCRCRKPKPGLIQRALEELNLDKTRSYMVGDNERDYEAGLAAGCQAIWLSSTASQTPRVVPDGVTMADGWTEIRRLLSEQAP